MRFFEDCFSIIDEVVKPDDVAKRLGINSDKSLERSVQMSCRNASFLNRLINFDVAFEFKYLADGSVYILKRIRDTVGTDISRRRTSRSSKGLLRLFEIQFHSKSALGMWSRARG